VETSCYHTEAKTGGQRRRRKLWKRADQAEYSETREKIIKGAKKKKQEDIDRIWKTICCQGPTKTTLLYLSRGTTLCYQFLSMQDYIFSQSLLKLTFTLPLSKIRYLQFSKIIGLAWLSMLSPKAQDHGCSLEGEIIYDFLPSDLSRHMYATVDRSICTKQIWNEHFDIHGDGYLPRCFNNIINTLKCQTGGV
jgi:hypothetical protein